MSFVGDIFDGITGKTAADASLSAADTSAQFQREALDYLKQAQEPLLQAQQFGLSGLMDFYGGNQQGLINQVQANPFYQSMIGQGEEAVLRNAAATGGLRGGNVQQALAQNSQNVLQGLTNQYLGGFGQLAGFQPNTAGVASMTSGIGNTLAQGQLGAAQAEQQGIGNLVNIGTSLAGLFGGSDARLKMNITPTGEVNGFKWYTWEWNSIANRFGLYGSGQGVLAHEVEETHPHLVREVEGYKMVNYGEILNG